MMDAYILFYVIGVLKVLILLDCILNLSWCGGCLHVLGGNQALQVGLLGQCSYSITLLMVPAIYNDISSFLSVMVQDAQLRS
jgi:hypothetical protein